MTKLSLLFLYTRIKIESLLRYENRSIGSSRDLPPFFEVISNSVESNKMPSDRRRYRYIGKMCKIGRRFPGFIIRSIVKCLI